MTTQTPPDATIRRLSVPMELRIERYEQFVSDLLDEICPVNRHSIQTWKMPID